MADEWDGLVVGLVLGLPIGIILGWLAASTILSMGTSPITVTREGGRLKFEQG